MDNPEERTFHCDLIDPTGKLLDCSTASVVLPAHDGLIGILYNHLPMLYQLGLGIMRVSTGPAEGAAEPQQEEMSFFVDGGFALVASNSVMVVAYEALALRNVRPGKIESMAERAARNASDPTLSAGQRVHESERLRVLRRLAASAKP
jgi:F-type H+-transporting ATPase subunit epsilon